MSDVFDRCDPNTMTTIETALAEARSLGHSWLGTEHLLLALVEHRSLLPTAVAQLLPEDADTIRAALTAELDGPPPRDAELLATLGIDLDGVRAAVRQTFGPEALDRLAHRGVHQPWQPWRQPSRRCTSTLAGGTTLAPRVKQALEHALADADRRHKPTIDPAGLLLGMTEVDGALSNRLLRELGVPPGDVRAAIARAAP